jgi:hypothetical protein
MKEELGLDHFEGRSWRGFHHHAAMVMLAYGFLLLERERKRGEREWAGGRQVPRKKGSPSGCRRSPVFGGRGSDCSARWPNQIACIADHNTCTRSRSNGVVLSSSGSEHAQAVSARAGCRTAGDLFPHPVHGHSRDAAHFGDLAGPLPLPQHRPDPVQGGNGQVRLGQRRNLDPVLATGDSLGVGEGEWRPYLLAVRPAVSSHNFRSRASRRSASRLSVPRLKRCCRRFVSRGVPSSVAMSAFHPRYGR